MSEFRSHGFLVEINDPISWEWKLRVYDEHPRGAFRRVEIDTKDDEDSLAFDGTPYYDEQSVVLNLDEKAAVSLGRALSGEPYLDTAKLVDDARKTMALIESLIWRLDNDTRHRMRDAIGRILFDQAQEFTGEHDTHPQLWQAFRDLESILLGRMFDTTQTSEYRGEGTRSTGGDQKDAE